MALIELHFADANEKKLFTCKGCKFKEVRKCKDEGFDNVKGIGISINKRGIKFPFCPGKATWYPEIVELFDSCRVAVQTGIMPLRGALADQSYEFYDVFPTFVDLWKKRTYQSIWDDVIDHTEAVLVKTGLVKKRGAR